MSQRIDIPRNGGFKVNGTPVWGHVIVSEHLPMYLGGELRTDDEFNDLVLLEEAANDASFDKGLKEAFECQVAEDRVRRGGEYGFTDWNASTYYGGH